MTDNVIQSQIRLITFKAVRLEFACVNEILEPKFNLGLDDLVFPDNPKLFAKVFNIDLVVGLQTESISYKIGYHAVFECSMAITSDFLNSDFAKISAPAIGFPYVRSFISTISVQAGLPPIILPSINFVQYSHEKEARLKG